MGANAAVKCVRAALLAVGIAFFGGALMGAPGVIAIASAHDAVLNSTPVDGSTVESFPRKIVLEFSGIPKDNFNTIAVTDSSTNELVFSAEPTRDKQFMSVTVPEGINPGPGHYIVGFQITSSDGHATRGKISFAVAGRPEASAAATTTTVEPSVPVGDESVIENKNVTGSDFSLGSIVGITALIAVCVGVFVIFKKRK